MENTDSGKSYAIDEESTSTECNIFFVDLGQTNMTYIDQELQKQIHQIERFRAEWKKAQPPKQSTRPKPVHVAEPIEQKKKRLKKLKRKNG